MGSHAAHSWIERVLAAHRTKLHNETSEDLPEGVKAPGPKLQLEGEIDEIERWLVFAGPDGEPEYWLSSPLTIFDLKSGSRIARSPTSLLLASQENARAPTVKIVLAPGHFACSAAQVTAAVSRPRPRAEPRPAAGARRALTGGIECHS
jgi:hypothetical protein